MRKAKPQITDTQRLDALERFVRKEGALLLHSGQASALTGMRYSGISFWDGFRDLRKALDGLVEEEEK